MGPQMVFFLLDLGSLKFKESGERAKGRERDMERKRKPAL